MRLRLVSGVSVSRLREIFALVWTEADAFVKSRMTIALLLITIASALTALGPVALKVMVDGFTRPTPGAAMSAALWIGLYVLSQCLFGHVLRLPLRFHLERSTGGITQSLTNGLQGYQTVLHTLVFGIVPVATELGTIVVVLAKLSQPVFLEFFCAAIVCYAIVFTYAARRTMKAARSASAAQVEANGTMTDSILNYEAVKCFAAEALAERKVGGALVRTEEEWVRFYRQFAFNGLLVATIYATFLGTSILYAAREVQGGRISIGTFVLVNTYMLQIVRPIEALGYAVQALSQGVAYLDKMLELFRERTEPQPAPDTMFRSPRKPPPSAELAAFPPRGQGRGADGGPGELEFRNVHLSYRSDRSVLNGVSFKIPAGKKLGIVGASGSGKSTIVRLLVRLLEPDSGTILVDGVPIQDWSVTRLRQSIAVVPQDTVLFNDTIGYNIGFGRSGSSQEDIEEAAKLAHLHEFILTLPERYGTLVGERGVKLSGGERQRVSIARAVVKRPRIYVADEATSSLDSNTEREIINNLEEVSRNTTTLVISHRLSTVVHADNIVVLDGGTIVEQGKHTSLVRQSGPYAALWQAQQHGSVAA
jgi:ATP-binding cassette subfamily B protein